MRVWPRWVGRLGIGAVMAGLGLHAGCNEDRTLVCGVSIDEACADPGSCVLTWDEARLDSAFCDDGTRTPPLRIECGAYHIASLSFVDYSRTYYYDAASGMLVAIVNASAVTQTTTCEAGPGVGFVPPVCTGAGSQTLVCPDGGGDAGADGIAD